jgi:hypothetical protein
MKIEVPADMLEEAKEWRANLVELLLNMMIN